MILDLVRSFGLQALLDILGQVLETGEVGNGGVGESVEEREKGVACMQVRVRSVRKEGRMRRKDKQTNCGCAASCKSKPSHSTRNHLSPTVVDLLDLGRVIDEHQVELIHRHQQPRVS
jgi:hypothetical protein